MTRLKRTLVTFLMLQLYCDTLSCYTCNEWGLLFSYENFYLNFVKQEKLSGQWQMEDTKQFFSYQTPKEARTAPILPTLPARAGIESILFTVISPAPSTVPDT